MKQTDPYQPYWFGSKDTGLLYKNLYEGGLNAYKAMKDMKLLMVNDLRNEQFLLDVCEFLTEEDIEKIREGQENAREFTKEKFKETL